MILRFHPAVQHDINEVLTYYSERSPTTAERFWKALHERFGEIAENPGQFAFINQSRGLRRARLRKFPYRAVSAAARAGRHRQLAVTASPRQQTVYRPCLLPRRCPRN